MRRSIVPSLLKRCSRVAGASSRWRRPIAAITARPPIASSVALMTPPCRRWCVKWPISSGFIVIWARTCWASSASIFSPSTWLKLMCCSKISHRRSVNSGSKTVAGRLMRWAACGWSGQGSAKAPGFLRGCRAPDWGHSRHPRFHPPDRDAIPLPEAPMTRRTPAWFDAQYDNRARVPGSAAQIERWARASQLVREQSPCVLDLAYGDAPSERLDVFPTDAKQAPVLVFLHGGYWRALDKSDHSFIASVFTAEGAMVVVPNYALCPGVAMERIPLQLTQALAWIWRHAAEHGGDPNRIVVAGHSAGGHLATMLSCCDWKSVAPDLPRHLVKG